MRSLQEIREMLFLWQAQRRRIPIGDAAAQIMLARKGLASLLIEAEPNHVVARGRVVPAPRPAPVEVASRPVIQVRGR